VKKGDFVWLGIFCAVSAVFLVPASREVAMGFSKLHPYLMGFIKFALLASMGELLGLRIAGASWKKPLGFYEKVVVWGLIGVVVTLMFTLFSAGVAGAVKAKLLWAGSGEFSKYGTAFLISATMNLVFAPVFMITHRFTDTYIDIWRGEGRRPDFSELITKIDWQGLIGFVVAKTIPFFWIPAHTAVFLLPGEYRILASAYLSIVLGIILSFAKGRKRQGAEVCRTFTK